MPSDWKESAIKRKDFRHSKTDPEVAKHKCKPKKRLKFKVICKNFKWSFTEEKPYDWCLGKYIKIGSAENAVIEYKKKSYLKGFEIIIEEI